MKQRPQQGAGTTAGILPKKGLARAEFIDFWSCRRRRRRRRILNETHTFTQIHTQTYKYNWLCVLYPPQFSTRRSSNPLKNA